MYIEGELLVNPFNGIESISVRRRAIIYEYVNPFNGIESDMGSCGSWNKIE